jgi:hypothetical protein
MRRFDGTVPLLVVGMAAAIAAARRWVARHPRPVVGAALAVLVIWNVTFMSAALAGAFGIGEIVSFGEVGGAQARALHRWVGHPFSWPANLLWAARNGQSPGRYDRLGPGRFLADPLRPYGRIDVGLDDEPFLAEGWHGAEWAGPTTFRWARNGARLLVPLDHAADLVLQVQVMPFVAPGASPVSLDLSVNGRRFGPFPLAPGWQRVDVTVPRDAWRAGVNRLELGTGRETRPVDVDLGSDDRPLSAAFDYVRVRVP